MTIHKTKYKSQMLRIFIFIQGVLSKGKSILSLDSSVLEFQYNIGYIIYII